tara:strand:- start:6278 stop:6925 length:648 start_codon:yes stop_codon:yes gene_type:complete
MNQETIKRILSSAVLIPIALFFIFKGSFFFIFFMSIFFLVTAYEWHQMTKKKSYLYPGLLFLFISSYLTYLFRNDNNNEAFLIFLTVILTCVSTDIGGYIFGKIFKGPKLIKISPNKTYAGMFGGYFLSIISVNIFFNYTYLLGYRSIEFNREIFALILLISTISQIGDLIVSYFKRASKIKNTGKIIPGHGGLLDRVDGLIFAVPFAYLLFKFL